MFGRRSTPEGTSHVACKCAYASARYAAASRVTPQRTKAGAAICKKHDRFTDPGEHTTLLQTLPVEMDALHAAINGILIHVWKIRKHSPERLQSDSHDVFTRRIECVLARVNKLDNQALSVARPKAKQVIVDCRTFSLLLCSVLRERGIPARSRCGFATYLENTHYQDHWICEVWSSQQGRWVMEDADLKMHDVSPEQFFNGVRAWRHGRRDAAFAAKCGWSPRQSGLWAARLNLVRDFAALNGFAAVSGDGWQLGNAREGSLAAADLALLDHAAILGIDDTRFEERCKFYAQSATLRPPDVIQHFDYLTLNRSRNVAWENTD